ncbi:MAG: hypothetical protein ABR987_20870 [Terracidiphilus sp.]
MDFNLKRFLRRAAPDVLHQYLDVRQINLAGRVDWQNPMQTQPDALFAVITALAQRDRDAIITDFENVEQLCDAVGQVALHSVAAGDKRVLFLLQSADSNVAKSIALLLAHGTLFEYALAAAYADRLLMGRSWSAFNINASATIGFSSPNLPAFEAELTTALTRPDGSTGKLKIDSFERGTFAEDGKLVGLNVHYAIYSEGLPVSDVAFVGDELKRETRHPVHEGAILYDADGSTLDVVAGGGKAVRNRIADSFAQNMLGIKGKVHPVSARQFDLNRLRRPMAFDSDPADGIKIAKLTLLRLARAGSRYERVTIEVDPSDRIDLCTRSTQWFGDADPLRWPDWYVTHATLRIVFHPEPGRTRDKIVSIQLRSNGSNLRDQTLQHQVVCQKYLARWRLVAASGG